MNRFPVFLLITFVLTSFNLSAQEEEAPEQISGEELISRSIAFHDPSGQWNRMKINMLIDQELPNGAVRPSKIEINNLRNSFELSYVRDNHLFNWAVNARDSAEILMDFRMVSDSVLVDSLQLNSERAVRWRNYYTYLYGLPMKLRDEGTIVGEQTERTFFNNQEVLSVKVTYAENVGSDTWYFYFQPETYELVGCRFYHNQALNDGEYIVFEGLEIQQGMRIPKHRTWFTNQENKWLGTDRLISIKLLRQ